MSDISAKVLAVLLLLAGSSTAFGQEVRYSSLDISFVQQDVDRNGSLADIINGQALGISTKDGDGTEFRGSVGTWKDLFEFVDYSSTGIDVGAIFRNAQGQFPAEDKFDFTTVRVGVGLKRSLTRRTDICGALSFDSTVFDFGCFAGEDFDTDNQDVGATLGIRSMISDEVELRAHVRYTGVGDVDLNTGVLDSDTLFGAGFGYKLVRGLSITGDYEAASLVAGISAFVLVLTKDRSSKWP